MLNIRKITILLLLTVIAVSAVSCKSEIESVEAPAVQETVSEAAETEFVYEFNHNYNGEEISILNVKDVYGMHSSLDRDSETGETLDDAMFNRCRKVEELLNIKLIEVFGEYGNGGSASIEQIRKLVMANEDIYDITYVSAEQNIRTLGAEGYLYNLTGFSELNLDREWWFREINDISTINGKLYAAAGSSNLMGSDSTWCLYFNESMMSDLGLEFPYQLVRDGKWTVDRMIEYTKTAANLNGDESFAFKKNSSCTYGLSMNGATFLLYGTGEMFFEINNSGIEVTAGNERFYDAVESIVNLINGEDGRAYRMLPGTASGDDSEGSYMWMFENERSLFLEAELSKTSRMRDKEFEFGILPNPKLDENQEKYCHASGMAMSFAIPITCKTSEQSAVIGDALTYISFTDVIGVWREVTIEQKGLRNDDSIEMLEIIMNTTVTRPNVVYGIGSSFISAISTEMFTNLNSSLASVIDANLPAVNKEIADGNF